MKIQLILAFCLLSLNLNAQKRVFLSEEKATEDLQKLKDALEYVHPRLYKYTSKETFDSLFSTASKKLESGIFGLDFLSLVSQINAHINCGHLYTIPQFELMEEVKNKKVMPFYIRLLKEELYLIDDCSDQLQKLNGAKILSINGVSSKEIIREIKKGIATDGYIESRKNRLIERYFFYARNGFDLYYHLHVDRSTDFLVECETYHDKQIRKINFQGISFQERQKRLKERYQKEEIEWFNKPSPQFEIFEDQNYAVLAITRSFYDQKIDPDFKETLQTAFLQLKQKNIEHLIIDLRNNEGGSEMHEMETISYLYDQPYKLYQNIYLSHLDYRPLKDIIIERDSSLLVFNNDDAYMRKIANDLWISNYEYGANLRLQPPKENLFRGKLFVLTNGITFSSAANLAASIRKTTDATFIGEETGGVFEGPTGGASIVVQLPHSKIMVRISPNIHIGYLYQKHEFGRGVLPDYPIEYTIEEVMNQKDLEMEKAIELISNQD